MLKGVRSGPSKQKEEQIVSGGGTAGNVEETAKSSVIFMTRQEMGADEAPQVGKARPGRAWCPLTWGGEPLRQKPRTIL